MNMLQKGSLNHPWWINGLARFDLGIWHLGVASPHLLLFLVMIFALRWVLVVVDSLFLTSNSLCINWTFQRKYCSYMIYSNEFHKILVFIWMQYLISTRVGWPWPITSLAQLHTHVEKHITQHRCDPCVNIDLIRRFGWTTAPVS